jgi:hypothetical protein
MVSFSDPSKSTDLTVYSPQMQTHEVRTQEMLDLFTERSFESQVADHQHFSDSWIGSVVVLDGGSTAGKSSIVNALLQLDSGMHEEGSDLTGANFIYEFMATNLEQFAVSKKDWQHLHSVLEARPNNWHIHEAVAIEKGADPSTYGFKEGTSVEDQERAIKTALKLHGPVSAFAENVPKILDDVILQKVQENVKTGTNVTLDMHDINKIIEHPIGQHAQIKSVFVYCPFEKLSERIAERNRKALSGEIDLSELRPGTFPLIQYAELLRPKKEGDDDLDSVETLTLGTVKEHFRATFDATIEVLKRTPEGRAQVKRIEESEAGIEGKRSKEEQDLVKAFGFTKEDSDSKSIELVPRKQYDLRIDTSMLPGSSPAERAHTAAKIILRGV